MRSRSGRITGGFFILLLALAGGGIWLGLQAQEAILDSQAGSVSEFSLDPSEAGFRAFTEPTPTALVVHTGVTARGAELIGLTVLSAADGGSGGTVVTMPATLRVAPEAPTVAEVFLEQGLDDAVAQITDLVKVDFASIVVLDGRSWTSLMLAELPLTLTLNVDLLDVEGAGVQLEAGTRPFDLVDVAQIATHRNEGEPALGVALRQQEIWRSWIARTAGSDERPELFDLGTDFSSVIGALASGQVAYRVVPTTTQTATLPENTSYLVDVEATLDLFATIVPFPEEVNPGDRPSVILLDASSGQVDQIAIVEAVSRAGGRVVILGNAGDTGSGVSEVQLHEEAARPVADAIAAALGVAAPQLVPLDDATAAITIIADGPTQ